VNVAVRGEARRLVAVPQVLDLLRASREGFDGVARIDVDVERHEIIHELCATLLFDGALFRLLLLLLLLITSGLNLLALPPLRALSAAEQQYETDSHASYEQQ